MIEGKQVAPFPDNLIENAESFPPFALLDQRGDLVCQVRRQDGPETDARRSIAGHRGLADLPKRVLAFDLNLAQHFVASVG